jgi:hypothetical protein
LKTKTIVVFRQWKRAPNKIIALFPEVPDDINGFYCVSYERGIKHSAADYDGVVSRTVPAPPAQVTALMRELKALGYDLEIRTRYSKRRAT